MKLLLDQNLSAGAAVILRSRGMDVFHARETGLATAADGDILAWALEKGRVIVTLDADFHALLALSAASAPSVIRIRIEGLHDQELANLIARVIHRVEADLLRGSVVTVTVTSIRVRALPLTTR